MSEIRAMNLGGDSKLIWSADNEAEVEAARNMFDDLRDQGFAAFSVDKEGEQDRRIEEFDPEAEKIIMVPPIRGG